MFKKILTMIFFWSAFIGFFYCFFNMKAPSGTTLNVHDQNLEAFLVFIGIFVFSIFVGGFICMSYEFLIKKDIK